MVEQRLEPARSRTPAARGSRSAERGRPSRATARGVAGDGDADLVGARSAPRVVSTPTTRAPSAADAGDLAVLDDVDARDDRPRARSPRRRHRGARCRRAAGRRPPRIGKRASSKVEHRGMARTCSRSSSSASMPFRRMALPRRAAASRWASEWYEIEHAALAEHDVEVEVLAQAFPKSQGMLVELGVGAQQVVGAHDRGVASGVAAAQPALLQHRDIGDAVLLGEVVGRRQAVAAAADDHHLVAAAWDLDRARHAARCDGRAWHRARG